MKKLKYYLSIVITILCVLYYYRKPLIQLYHQFESHQTTSTPKVKTTNVTLSLDEFNVTDLVKTYPNYTYQVDIAEEDKATYQQLFQSLTPDVAVFESKPTKQGDAPTRATVLLNHTSITRQKGNQQHFDKNTIGWTKNREVYIHNPVYKTYKGHFWNRSHLIADSLGGEATPRNAITGTRPQNVGGDNNSGGMRVPEVRAQEYIEKHPKALLLYDAVPLYFKDSDLVPYAVQVTLWNDDIQERYIVLNIAYGFEIDYATGKYHEVTVD